MTPKTDTSVIFEQGGEALGVRLLAEMGVVEKDHLVRPHAITVLRHGKPVGAVVAERVNGHSCFLHVGAKNPRWVSRTFLNLVSFYLFRVLDLSYVYGMIHVRNRASIRLASRFGMQLHATLPGALSDGDARLFMLERQNAPFLDDDGVHELTVLDGDSERQGRLIYNAKYSLLFVRRGKRLLSEAPVPVYRSVPRQGVEAKSRNPKVLKVFFGFGCNYSCSYCSQSMHRGKPPPQDVRGFLAKLDAAGVEEPERVELWGGEPLAYWETVHQLLPALRNRFPLSHFRLITNGALLTTAKAALLVHHRVEVVLSHDGPAQAQRGKDPLDSLVVVSALQELADAGFLTLSTVITGENTSPIRVQEYVQEKIDRAVPLEGVGPARSYGADLSFGHKAVQVHASLVRDVLKEDTPVREEMRRWLSSIEHCVPRDVLGTSCGVERGDVLTVDLAGNVLLCQNTGPDRKIGHLQDLSSARASGIRLWYEREQCRQCPVIHICMGGCSYQSESDFQATCKNLYTYNMALLTVALFSTTGYILLESRSLTEQKDEQRLRRAS